MRYLLVNNVFTATPRSGSEAMVRREAELLLAQGHEVIVVAPGDGERCADSAGFDVWTFRISNGFTRERRHKAALWWRLAAVLADLNDDGNAKQIVELARKWRADIVHSHNLSGIGLKLAGALRAANIRHWHTVHDVQLINPSGLIPVAGSSWPWSWLEKPYAAAASRLMGSPERVIFPSEFLKKYHLSRGFFAASDCRVERNPCPMLPVEKRVVPATPRVLFVGQLEPHKGVNFLLHIWNGLAHGPAHLEFVGDGSLRQEIEEACRADASIIYAGPKNGDELIAAYDRATLVVVPSLVLENSPTTILEAQVRGVPVLAADQGGIPELMTSADHLVAAGDLNAWHEALVAVIGAGGVK